MKKCLLFCILVWICGCKQKVTMPTIEYQVEHFQLNRSFGDYDEYKEDPGNLHLDEIERIKAAILAVKIANDFESKQEFVLAALKIKFPGYGFGGLESASNLYTTTIEIPGKGSARYITSIEREGRWYVADDFVGLAASGGASVQIEDGQFTYKSHEGVEFRRKRLD